MGVTFSNYVAPPLAKASTNTLGLGAAPIHTDAVAHYPYNPGIESAMTFVSKYGDVVNMSHRYGDNIAIPRRFAPSLGIDNRSDNFIGVCHPKVGPRDSEQARCVKESLILLNKGVDHIIESPTGCHERGYPIIMADGTVMPVEDVEVGDLLAGPSGPRRVLALLSGKAEMAKIVPVKGDPFVVTEDHVLALKHTETKEVVCVTIREWRKWSKYKKHCHKLFRSEAVEFGGGPTRIDPYAMGVLLGDGSMKTALGLTSFDLEVVQWMREYVQSTGLYFIERTPGHFAITRSGPEPRGVGTNWMCRELHRLGVFGCGSGEKFIPHEFKAAPILARMQLIAGLMDTDGHLSNGVYDYISKSKRLAEDVVFVCRSIGLAAYITECKKGCTYKGEYREGTYYRVSISGHVDKIPCMIPRKKAKPRSQVKDALVTGFTVEAAEPGDYFGFTLDGDQLYLMGDFTVTHNSGKSMMGVLIAMALGRTTLIVVTKEDLITGWIKNLKLAGVPEHEIGIAQADKLKYKGCRFVIGMIHSLSIRGKYDDDFLRYFGFVIFDEVHRAAADQFMVSAQVLPAKLRLGLSATPERSDGKDLVLRGHIGPVLVRGTMIPMKPRVLLYETGWAIPDYCKNFGPGQMMIVEKAMAYNDGRNAIIARFVKQAFDAGRNTVVMSSNLVHLDKLQLAIGPLVGGENIGRYVGQMAKAELEIGSKKRVVLATYGMCAEGTDCPWWDTLVPATPRKDQKQINGRVMRSLEGKKEPVILDLLDKSPIYRAYRNHRLKQYHSVGATIVNMRTAA